MCCWLEVNGKTPAIARLMLLQGASIEDVTDCASTLLDICPFPFRGEAAPVSSGAECTDAVVRPHSAVVSCVTMQRHYPPRPLSPSFHPQGLSLESVHAPATMQSLMCGVINLVCRNSQFVNVPAPQEAAMQAAPAGRRRAPRRSAASLSAGAYAEPPIGQPATDQSSAGEATSEDENDAPALPQVCILGFCQIQATSKPARLTCNQQLLPAFGC